MKALEKILEDVIFKAHIDGRMEMVAHSLGKVKEYTKEKKKKKKRHMKQAFDAIHNLVYKKKYPAREDTICLHCGGSVDEALGNGICNDGIDETHNNFNKEI